MIVAFVLVLAVAAASGAAAIARSPKAVPVVVRTGRAVRVRRPN